MIDLTFEFGPELIWVRVNGNSITFANTMYGSKMADISGLKLSREGVVKEFPDLDMNEEWRGEAIKRFKVKIRTMTTEIDKAKYIVEELKKNGYNPKKMQVAGSRPVKIPWRS